MKSKKSIYILLPVVLSIWGVVIFQFFSFSTPDEVITNTSMEFTVKPFKLKERTPFLINVNYRDPFLGKIYNTQVVTKGSTSKVKIKKEIKPEETIVWPSIQYKGMLSDPKEKHKRFMLVIAGKNYFMKTGDMQEEIFLKNGDKESIYVTYKGNLNLILLDN
ncbi:MAG TPA: hypothetical protein VFS71_07540 [Flavobacterium sp.]|uniref:hypothetical protein n=1 Tax=Flavobacterium sp. TaxID=239 RepID=UPI002DB9D3C3|nr:hypothetical protein [Flavobacterium sp.]HEU4789521.1 hypothetical protein [Flavobacterium sp.]